MKYLILILMLLVLPMLSCHGDNSDDTLKYYLSKSDLVVHGKIVSEVATMIDFISEIGSVFDEEGALQYLCDFKIEEVVKGLKGTAMDVAEGDKSLIGQTIKVIILVKEADKKDHNPLLKKDSECVLFLKARPKGCSPEWVTADLWFGIQHPFPTMIKSLKRVVNEK